MKKFFSGIKFKKILCLLVLAGILFIGNGNVAYATENTDLNGTENEQTHINDAGTMDSDEFTENNIANRVTITTDGDNGSISGSLQILITLTMIAISPILLIMLTSFTRVIIVLHFTRAALNTNTAPPNQVLIGLALFLTFFIMGPAISEINDGQPFGFVYPENGSPYSLTGSAIIEGHQNKPGVAEVFDFVIHDFMQYDKENFSPEQIYEGQINRIPNYPADILYADMAGIQDDQEKERLLALWKY